MHKNLRLQNPDGEILINPNINYIKQIIINKDEQYWGKNTSGSSMIDFFEKGINIYSGELSLLYFYDSPHGFFIFYDMNFVPLKFIDELKDEVVIEHFVGCEPMNIPAICYRSREEAWKIIEHFILHKTMLETYKWVALSEIIYDDNF